MQAGRAQASFLPDDSDSADADADADANGSDSDSDKKGASCVRPIAVAPSV
ncbi:hypothetical protein GGI07_004230 [Coemansia sp. Benny D115]|nr:hypothetical protein GGI07_004230 [Coemansia sp. Benny D115]